MANREVISIAKVDTSRPNKVGVQASDNRWFGVFDKALWPRLVEGAHLNVEWNAAGEDGKYRNIVSILGTAASTNGAAPDSREKNIVRESALRAACDLYAFHGLTTEAERTDTAVDWVLHVADRFARWIADAEEDALPF